MKPELKIAEEKQPEKQPEEAQTLEATPPQVKRTPQEAFDQIIVPSFFVQHERSNFLTITKDVITFASPDNANVGGKMLEVLERFDNALALYCTNSYIISYLAEMQSEGKIKSFQELIDEAERLESIFNQANYVAVNEALNGNAKINKMEIPYTESVEESIKFILKEMIRPESIENVELSYERKHLTVDKYNTRYDDDAKNMVPLTFRGRGAANEEDAKFYVVCSFLRMPMIVHSFGIMRDLLRQAEKEGVQWGPYMQFLSVFNASMHSIACAIPKLEKGGKGIPEYLGALLSSSIGAMLQCVSLDDKKSGIGFVTMVVDEIVSVTEKWAKENGDAQKAVESVLPENWALLMKLETYKNLAISALVVAQSSDLGA